MNNNNNDLSILYSWPVIIIAFLFFWPVGVFLFLKRVSQDRQAAMSTGKLIGIVGYILFGIGALTLISAFSGGFSFGNVIVGLLFIAGGLALLKVKSKTKKDADNVRKYLAIIVNGGERQLDAIASAMGKQYDEVKNDIQKMIDQGYLRNAYINENTREVVLPTPKPVQQPTVSYESSVAAPAQPQTRVVACPCCGANNTVFGEVGECEYCGSPIK